MRKIQWRLPRGRALVWSAAGTALVVVAVAWGIGLFAFHADSNSQTGGITTGATDTADRLSISATVERVNAATDDMSLRVWATPHGTLSAAGGSAPSRDIVMSTPGLTQGTVTLPAGKRIGAQNLLVELDSGEFARYPFDRYAAQLYFSASVDGHPVPVDLVLDDSDPLFTIQASPGGSELEPGFDVEMARSRGTFTMVSLMFVIMWALALAVTVGALVIVRTRRGLVWPAMGWMAATLFALAGFRNTAPGSPPIGCLLDYTAFLWAEAIVAFSLVCVVAFGTWVEVKPSDAQK